MDPLSRVFADGLPRRLLLIGTLLLLLFVFAELIPVLAAFAVTQRALDAARTSVASWTGLSPGRATALVLVGSIGALVGALWFGGGYVWGAVLDIQEGAPALLAQVHDNAMLRPWIERVGEEDLAETGWEAAVQAMEIAHEVALLAINVAVGIGLGILYAVESDVLSKRFAELDPRSIGATLVRWIDHIGDGLAITIQLQVGVAACNAVLTLPALLLLGLPHLPSLVAMIFLLALIPVVGNLMSGVILAAVAWPSHGWLGIGVFAAITFALGKVEGFVLNPRLAARHVDLPGFVLTVSLVAWEAVYGFQGFFLSFPFLYTCARIRQEMRDGLA